MSVAYDYMWCNHFLAKNQRKLLIHSISQTLDD